MGQEAWMGNIGDGRRIRCDLLSFFGGEACKNLMGRHLKQTGGAVEGSEVQSDGDFMFGAIPRPLDKVLEKRKMIFQQNFYTPEGCEKVHSGRIF
jgi:hypothetical protein